MSAALMTRRDAVVTLAAALASTSWLLACARDRIAPGPVDIAIGHDECDYCRMIIDDPKLAAEFVAESGRAHRFGEPGCLAAWLRERRAAGGATRGAAFVTASDAGTWLPAAEARYLRGRRTPMGFDIVAYRIPPADEGTPLQWEMVLREGGARVAPR